MRSAGTFGPDGLSDRSKTVTNISGMNVTHLSLMDTEADVPSQAGLGLREPKAKQT